MHRFVSILIALAAVTLGAMPASSAPAYVAKPSVIVYPLTSNGSSIDREASSRLATIIATGIANTGKASVIPPPPGTERKDYLTTARGQGADFYVAGFISPLGNGASIVEQVVSVSSGVVVYSTTTQITTYAEAAGGGEDIAEFVSRYANRSLSQIPTPPPQTSPTPRAESEKNGTSTSLGGLFRRKKPAATAAPTTAPAAAVRNTAVSAPSAAPARAVPTGTPAAPVAPARTPAPAAAAAGVPVATVALPAIVNVGGSAESDLRALATRLFADRGFTAVETRAAACTGAPMERAVAGGALTTRADSQFGGTSATFEFTVVTCAGRTVFRRDFIRDAGGADSARVATERAVEAALGAYTNRR